MSKYKVVEYDEQDWDEIDACNAGDAAEQWASRHWLIKTQADPIELTVRGVVDDQSWAVTVDIHVEFSASCYPIKEST